jgi:protein subunit release factor A
VPRREVSVLTVTIKDCEVQHFRSGGKGGQNQNKVSSGTRVIHTPSGARGEARDSRSQVDNTRAAFLRMVGNPLFQSWVREVVGPPQFEKPPMDRVRTYDFNSNRVVDHRTGKMSTRMKEILDGDLDLIR